MYDGVGGLFAGHCWKTHHGVFLLVGASCNATRRAMVSACAPLYRLAVVKRISAMPMRVLVAQRQLSKGAVAFLLHKRLCSYPCSLICFRSCLLNTPEAKPKEAGVIFASRRLCMQLPTQSTTSWLWVLCQRLFWLHVWAGCHSIILVVAQANAACC